MKKREANPSITNRKYGILICIILAILIITAAYFIFFHPSKCKDQACFDLRMEKCLKTFFTNDAESAVWDYEITGREGDKCKIEVELVQLKKGSSDGKPLEGKSMLCKIPFKIVQPPESDISLCSGELKEKLQDIIINRMHQYIYNNLGEIKEKFSQV